MSRTKTIAIIPARGGSKGIPRKNVRFLQGKPLISYTIRTALKCRNIDTVIVSTDDEEIAHIAEVTGCEVVMRPPHLADDHIPLDPVIHHAISVIESEKNETFDVVVTLQPTSPLLSQSSVDKALDKFTTGNADTIISVVDDRHLSWTKVDGKYVPLYEKRVNRQFLPANFRETGGFVITRRRFVTDESRFGPDIDLFELPHTESIDIDSYMDWWLADKLLERKRILIRTDGYREIGMGHVYRTLMLAAKLIDHELLFVTQKNHALGTDKIRDSHFKVTTFETDDELNRILDQFSPHIVINDILDTDKEYINSLKQRGLFVVNFEDLGPGSDEAHVVINALYETVPGKSNYFFGKNYYCLRDEFFLLHPKPIVEKVEDILITFGGTDSHDYAPRVLSILDKMNLKDIQVTVVTGLGVRNIDALKAHAAKLSLPVRILRDIRTISKFMNEADIIFTSAGRTVYEAASLGTPTMVMAQNEREMTHTFACEENGIVHLGLGYELSDSRIEEELLRMINDVAFRREMQKRMLGQNLKEGMDNVLKLIFETFEEYQKRDGNGTH